MLIFSIIFYISIVILNKSTVVFLWKFCLLELIINCCSIAGNSIYSNAISWKHIFNVGRTLLLTCLTISMGPAVLRSQIDLLTGRTFSRYRHELAILELDGSSEVYRPDKGNSRDILNHNVPYHLSPSTLRVHWLAGSNRHVACCQLTKATRICEWNHRISGCQNLITRCAVCAISTLQFDRSHYLENRTTHPFVSKLKEQAR